MPGLKIKKNISYSVVMAVYKNDNVEWLEQAANSVLDQTLKTDNFIIVRDGQVTVELEDALKALERKYAEISVARLNKNIGAGQARNVGVKAAKNELVAIMDADDICLRNRFELQMNEFSRNSELSLVGGQISEFEGRADNIIKYRKVPTNDAAIRKFARYRSPINHVTIMFKKTVFQKVGGYPSMSRAEDYYMVSSLLVKGYKICNIDTVLVNCRIGMENIQRRKNWPNVRENIISRWKIHKIGAISFVNFATSSSAQLAMLLIPGFVLGFIFNKTLRSDNG